MADTLMILEDEELLAGELAHRYAKEGWEVVRAGSLAEAHRMLFEERLDPLVVLADLSLPDGSSLELLAEVREHGGTSEWIFLTAYGSIHDAVRAMRLQAVDFVEKPCDLDLLDLTVTTAGRSARAQRRLRDQAEREGARYGVEAFIGRSPAACEVRELLARLSRLPVTSLVIEGESGTGKGLAARILHHNGPRAAEPLVAVNCAALPATLLEAELFGHEHGAYTDARGRRRGLLEQAHRGTLFLDEIGELELGLQAKLLAAIEDRKFRRLGGEREIAVDALVVAASNRGLTEMIAQHRFRADLYHRLSVFSLELPPLRRRREDLRDLVPHFVAELGARAGRPEPRVPEPMWRRLEAYDWPGNVRELRNVLERTVLLSGGDELSPRWLGLDEPAAASEADRAPAVGEGWVALALDGSMTLEEMEREILTRALARAGGNVTAAARSLGATRETVRYRVRKYGLAEKAQQ